MRQVGCEVEVVRRYLGRHRGFAPDINVDGPFEIGIADDDLEAVGGEQLGGALEAPRDPEYFVGEPLQSRELAEQRETGPGCAKLQVGANPSWRRAEAAVGVGPIVSELHGNTIKVETPVGALETAANPERRHRDRHTGNGREKRSVRPVGVDSEVSAEEIPASGRCGRRPRPRRWPGLPEGP